MQALTAYPYSIEGGCLAFAPKQTIRLLPSRSLRAMMPALMVLTRLSMGFTIGVIVGVIAGNTLFWLAIGLMLGLGLCRLADKVQAIQPPAGVLKTRS